MVGPVKDDSHAQESGSVLEIGDLMRLLPHRYPFLLIDRMIDIVPRGKVQLVSKMSQPVSHGFKAISHRDLLCLVS